MNIEASLGPMQVVLVTYIICIIISLGVAGIIRLLVGYINMKKKKEVKTAVSKCTPVKATAETNSFK